MMAYYRSRPTRVGFLFCKLDTPHDNECRAFWGKMAEARSEMWSRWHGRPCLFQKSDKGTVEIGGCGAQATVPFAKKRQRHGRNREAKVAGDRAFCKKATKARSKSRGRGRRGPCLLGKNVKGTVKIGGCGAQATVPFAKKRQRHGQNREAEGMADRAFWKKTSKARSKLEVVGCSRPCLLQKSVKGTVDGHRRPRIGAFGAGRSRPDGRRLVNKKADPHGSAPYTLP